jgi:hypothetical protein
MKKLLMVMLATVILEGCAPSATTISCKIYPEIGKTRFASVGNTIIEKEVCASRKEWRGLAGGGNVMVSECGKVELIYLGKAGDNIRINYREYVKDMARPAYFMEATYPAKPGNITFRNTQFEIIEVGDSGLKFKLISTPTDKCQQVYYR